MIIYVFCLVDGHSPLLRVYELRTPVKSDMPSAGSYHCYCAKCERTSRPASDLSFFWHHEDCPEFARAFIQANAVYLECEAAIAVPINLVREVPEVVDEVFAGNPNYNRTYTNFGLSNARKNLHINTIKNTVIFHYRRKPSEEYFGSGRNN